MADLAELGILTEEPSANGKAEKPKATVRKTYVTKTGCRKLVDMAAMISDLIVQKLGRPDWVLTDPERKALVNSLYETARGSFWANRVLELADQYGNKTPLLPTMAAIIAPRAISTETVGSLIPEEQRPMATILVGMAAGSWIGLKSGDPETIEKAWFEDEPDMETGRTSPTGRSDRQREDDTRPKSARRPRAHDLPSDENGRSGMAGVSDDPVSTGDNGFSEWATGASETPYPGASI